MEWWWLVVTAVLWLIGFGILLTGLRLTKENHEKKGVIEHSAAFPSFGNFSLLGFIFDIVSSLIYGVIMKYSPWWLAKTFLILLACLFFYWGFLAITKLI
ncbi:hypothetical protein SAMN04487897_10439 [Paenibacillus sp. yr247]|uniref:hypothetical protein n=1 Tax=Paenibacillus sp. yr247 TaxID=1761880 RepID=UPI00088814E0|nr:hypothetical protein [Paenibacillus sp. yr247]SDN67437.1 hypothetical protein SAMN04487897_10439 [Paenibacillus sp. yr247]